MTTYTFSPIDDPLATTGGTDASGINDLGQIVGSYGSFPYHGFLYSGGTYYAANSDLSTAEFVCPLYPCRLNRSTQHRH